MEKYIYDKKNGLWYELQGDYYTPCLVLDEEDTQPIGMWGRKHLRYIKEHRPVLHTTLLLSGKLNSYLSEIDNQAAEMFDRLVKQLAKKEGITEQLKAQDQMSWVQRMNNIRNAATEIVNAELIYQKTRLTGRIPAILLIFVHAGLDKCLLRCYYIENR